MPDIGQPVIMLLTGRGQHAPSEREGGTRAQKPGET
eukprot:SAG11_NODE_21753_length_419_cov_1.081250_1_plen_35_part_10